MKKTLHFCILAVVLIIIALTACKQDPEQASEPEKEYTIGDTGPAGGIIFYDKGNKTDGWRYLEAAPSDININSGVTFPWGDDGEFGTQTGIGTGKANTAIIVSQASNTRNNNAAVQCNNYTCGGCDDWFLPSKDELNLMYVNLHKNGRGGFAGDYWSSSESGGNAPVYAYLQYFSTGKNDTPNARYIGFRVRPVRAF